MNFNRMEVMKNNQHGRLHDFNSAVTKRIKTFCRKKLCKISTFILVENISGLVYFVLLSYMIYVLTNLIELSFTPDF